MAARFGAKLIGGDELLKALQEAGGNARKVVKAATRLGAKVIAADAERRASAIGSGSGKHVTVRSGRGGGMSAEMNVGLTKRKWFYRFFETGASQHEIVGDPLVFEGERGLVVLGRVRHPGLPAQPFLRPALDAQQGQAVEAMGAALRQAVEHARIARDSGDEPE